MFVLKLWNKQYGEGAKFIVQNESDEKYCEFSPFRPKDIAWVTNDLTKEAEYKDWDNFQNEKVENLEDVLM